MEWNSGTHLVFVATEKLKSFVDASDFLLMLLLTKVSDICFYFIFFLQFVFCSASSKTKMYESTGYLREIPNLTCATNLETLDLGGCSSLSELSSSIQNLHKLKDLDMERCTHLEILPTDINLESLYYLNLNGCSRLRSFPQISRSISDL